MTCSSLFTWIKREYRNNLAGQEFSSPGPQMIDASERVLPECDAYKRSGRHACAGS